MIEREGDGIGVEPDVEGAKHGAGERHAEGRLEGRRHVGRHHRHRVAVPDAALAQGRGEAMAARSHLAPAPPLRAMHERQAIGKDLGRALEEAERS